MTKDIATAEQNLVTLKSELASRGIGIRSQGRRESRRPPVQHFLSLVQTKEDGPFDQGVTFKAVWPPRSDHKARMAAKKAQRSIRVSRD